MKIVADTNTFLAVALNEPERDEIIGITAEASLFAPASLPFEIGNALSAMIKRRQVDENEVLVVEEFVRGIQVRLLPVEIRPCLQLAIQNNIYAYDAYFIRCAITLGCPLLTLDRRMKQVAAAIGVEILQLGGN